MKNTLPSIFRRTYIILFESILNVLKEVTAFKLIVVPPRVNVASTRVDIASPRVTIASPRVTIASPKVTIAAPKVFIVFMASFIFRLPPTFYLPLEIYFIFFILLQITLINFML